MSEEDLESPEEVLRVNWHGQAPAELLTMVGEWLEAGERGQESSEYYRAALAVDPNCSLAAYRLGHRAISLGRFAEAVEALEVAMRLAPDHAPTFHLASKAYNGLGRPDRAAQCADRALALNPLNVAAFLEKLRALAALERWREVEAAADGPFDSTDAPEILLWRALANFRLGRAESARDLYARVPLRLKRRYADVAAQIETEVPR
jgi:tetratricopeptide (TPR) repeat protein